MPRLMLSTCGWATLFGRKSSSKKPVQDQSTGDLGSVPDGVQSAPDPCQDLHADAPDQGSLMPQHHGDVSFQCSPEECFLMEELAHFDPAMVAADPDSATALSEAFAAGMDDVEAEAPVSGDVLELLELWEVLEELSHALTEQARALEEASTSANEARMAAASWIDKDLNANEGGMINCVGISETARDNADAASGALTIGGVVDISAGLHSSPVENANIAVGLADFSRDSSDATSASADVVNERDSSDATSASAAPADMSDSPRGGQALKVELRLPLKEGAADDAAGPASGARTSARRIQPRSPAKHAAPSIGRHSPASLRARRYSASSMTEAALRHRRGR